MCQEPASPATKPEVRRCEKHRSPGHAKAKEPAKEVAKEQQQPPPRPEQPPAAAAASGSPAHHRRLAGAGHSAGCRKVLLTTRHCEALLSADMSPGHAVPVHLLQRGPRHHGPAPQPRPSLPRPRDHHPGGDRVLLGDMSRVLLPV